MSCEGSCILLPCVPCLETPSPSHTLSKACLISNIPERALYTLLHTCHVAASSALLGIT